MFWFSQEFLQSVDISLFKRHSEIRNKCLQLPLTRLLRKTISDIFVSCVDINIMFLILEPHAYGEVNQLGGVFVNGRPLPNHIR